MPLFCSTALMAQNVDPMNPNSQQMQTNQPGRPQTPTASMRDSAGAPNETPEEMKDKMFLRKAAEGGLAQVEMGQLASSNGGSQEVKDLGQKLAEDHAKLNTSMASVADSIGVRLPKKMNKADQATYDRLKGLSGPAFDKEYLTCMVRDHHEDLREFRIESQSTTDTELKETVDQGAKILHDHLREVSRLAEQNGVPLPKHESKQQPPPQ